MSWGNLNPTPWNQSWKIRQTRPGLQAEMAGTPFFWWLWIHSDGSKHMMGYQICPIYHIYIYIFIHPTIIIPYGKFPLLSKDVKCGRTHPCSPCFNVVLQGVGGAMAHQAWDLHLSKSKASTFGTWDRTAGTVAGWEILYNVGPPSYKLVYNPI